MRRLTQCLRRGLLMPWLTAAAMTLASCSNQPIKPGSSAVLPDKQAALVKPTEIAAPPNAASSSAAINQRVESAMPPADIKSSVWDRLRQTFAIDDCRSDPGVLAWAHRYTVNPRRFESLIRQALPRLVYVQSVAARHDVAGEFVLLPWVESHYQPVKPHRRRPAGMWQIMPITAGSLGLPMNNEYDGRLNVAATTDAVMVLLRRYHDELGDWRLADYAFNAGEFAVRKLIAKHGAPAPEPVIPKLPVSRVTREHLTKLLGIACVIREPARFKVNLPTLPADQHLVVVPITHSMPIDRAAKLAGVSTDTLRQINTTATNGKLDSRYTQQLLLPHANARRFQQQSQKVANGGGTSPSPAARARRASTHKVRQGETLWQIAQRYSLNLKQLLRWNHLKGESLQIGQILLLSAPR